MGRNQNTVEKRVREMAKKRKAEEKRLLRRERKNEPDSPRPVNNPPDDTSSKLPS